MKKEHIESIQYIIKTKGGFGGLFCSDDCYFYKLGNICVAVNSWEKRFEKRYQAALKVVITEEDIFEAYL